MTAINSEQMLFQLSVINEGAEYLQWIECPPINQISEDSSIDLRVKASGSQYLDLQRSVLCVKAKIVKEDGTNLDASADKVIPINLFMQSVQSGGRVFSTETRKLQRHQLSVQSYDGRFVKFWPGCHFDTTSDSIILCGHTRLH